jgi:hypothetical protein
LVARALTAEQLVWLEKAPHIYRVNEFNLIAVSAGLNPHRSLEQQRPWEVRNMRFVNHESHETASVLFDLDSVAAAKFTYWAPYWRAEAVTGEQEKWPVPAAPTTILFGYQTQPKPHESTVSSNSNGYTTHCLDGGCAFGGQLRARIYTQGDSTFAEAAVNARKAYALPFGRKPTEAKTFLPDFPSYLTN